MQTVHFFVPLPEPLGLPDGFVFQWHGQPTFEDILEYDRQSGSQEGSPAPPLVASLRFWRATSSTDDPYEGKVLVDTARRALPSLDEPARQDAPPMAQDRTVVEMTVPLEEQQANDEDRLSDAFDRGLAVLRNLQRAYYAVGGKHPVTLLTREQMPPGVPVAIRRTPEGEDNRPEELGVFMVNTNLYADVRLPDLTVDQIHLLGTVTERIEGGAVFTRYEEFAREARLALNRYGDYRAAVLFGATATEVLLDDLLGHLLWEELVRPEDAATIFDEGGLIQRVKTQYHRRIGGSWSTSGEGPIANWSRDLAPVRHRVIHAGYEPDGGIARRALEAAREVERFVSDRLAASAVLTRYPRTAIVLLGKAGLLRRNRWSHRLQDLSDDSAEPLWYETFVRWQATMNRNREEGREYLSTPDARRGVVLVVLLPDGGRYWCVHDVAAAMASPLGEPDDSAIPPGQRSALEVAVAAVRKQAPPTAMSVAVGEASSWGNPSDWRPDYRVVPEAGVMLDQRNLDPDLGT